MSDLFPTSEAPTTKPKRGHPEANLQTKIAQWVRECVKQKHKFKAFERSKNSHAAGATVGRHFWEWNKGVRAGTLDTCLITEPNAVHRWGELKAPGVQIDPVEDAHQIQEIADIRALGGYADWTNSVAGYAKLLIGWGVELFPLAMLRAEGMDRTLAGAKTEKIGKRKRAYRVRKEKPSARTLKFGRAHSALLVRR